MIAVEVRREALSLLECGYSQRAVARRVGVARTTVECWASPKARKRRLELKQERKAEPAVNLVPVDALREAVRECERFGTSRSDICRRLGWSTRQTSALARFLGEMPWHGVKRTHIAEDMAVAILRAIHVDPWEIGL